MGSIREGSGECSTSPLEWFSMMPTQTAIEKSVDIEYQSLVPVTGRNALEFFVPGSTELYLDLKNSKLYVRYKIVKQDNANLAVTDVVTPVNDLLNSSFKNVELYMNDRLMSHSNNTHGYTSMIDHLIHDSEESMHSERAMRLIYKDTAGQMDVTEAREPNTENLVPGLDMEFVAGNAQATPAIPDTYRVIPEATVLGNNGLYKRYLHTRESQAVEVLAPLRIDMFEQERYIPSGVSIKLRFHRQENAFVLMAANDRYKLVIEDALLLIRKVRPSPGVQLGHHDALLKTPAKFPITRKECKVLSVAAGLRDVKKDNIFLGQLPKRVVIGMVDADAFAGVINKNPYNFKHFNARHMQLFIDGDPARSQPLKPVMGNGQFVHSYETLYRGINRLDGEKGCIIKRQDWSRGYSLCAFDLTPDMDADDHYALIKHGNLRLEVEFEDALASPISVLIYAEFDNVVEITADRNIQVDYV